MRTTTDYNIDQPSSSLVGEHMSTLFLQHNPPQPWSRGRPPLEDNSLYREKRKKKQSNCVSFAIDFVDDNIVERGYIIDEDTRLSLTREDIADNWFSPMELRHIHQDASQTAAGYREKHASNSSQDIDQLFDGVSQQQSSLIKSDSCCSHSKIYVPDQCRQVCRGLERQVYTSIRKHGRRYIKGILKVQSKLPADIKPEMKARLLRARSLQLSKPSRLLAKFLAHGDAVEVGELLVQDGQ
jgi:hypothetical protein